MSPPDVRALALALPDDERAKLAHELLDTLPIDDRAELAEVLLDSLQDEPLVLTAAQEAELDAAIEASDRGEGISADEALRELRAMATTTDG